MNTTNSGDSDDSNQIFIYIMLAVEILNSLVVIFTSYKLSHLDIIIDNVQCCCLNCDELSISISDSDIKEKING